VYAILSPDLDAVTTSAYLEDAHVTVGFTTQQLSGLAKKHIIDDQGGQASQKLWALSEAMTKPKSIASKL
jgi:hypothetical protein